MNHNFLKLCNFNNLQISISAVYESCVGDKQGGEIDKENKPPSPKEVRQPVVFHCYDCKRQFTRLPLKKRTNFVQHRCTGGKPTTRRLDRRHKNCKEHDGNACVKMISQLSVTSLPPKTTRSLAGEQQELVENSRERAFL